MLKYYYYYLFKHLYRNVPLVTNTVVMFIAQHLILIYVGENEYIIYSNQINKSR